MARWSAALSKIEPDPNGVNPDLYLTFTFADDSTPPRTHTLKTPGKNWTPESIAIYAQMWCEQYEAADVAQAALIAGPIQLPRDGFATPNADAQAVASAQTAKVISLSQQLASLSTLQSAAIAGLIPATDADLTAAQTAAPLVQAVAVPATPLPLSAVTL